MIQKIELSSALNSLATQSNIDKVTGMLGSSAANISKADLATVVAGIMGYKAPIIAYATSDSFWRITNINYQNEPAWGYIEAFISRSGTKEPNVLCIGISSSSNSNSTAINASQVLTGFITTNIVYKDDNYLYLRIPSYCRAIIKGTLIRGSVEATLATDVTEDDLTLVL